jgi:hypothetical protein
MVLYSELPLKEERCGERKTDVVGYKTREQGDG